MLREGLESIKVMAHWFGESMDSPEVTCADLQELTDSSPFDYVRFADKNGVNLAADGRKNDATDREYFIEGMSGKSGISITFVSRITSETLVNFYTPLEYDGEIIGVLRGVYLADNQMKKHLEASFFGVNAHTFLCTSDGELISCDYDGEVSGNVIESLQAIAIY